MTTITTGYNAIFHAMLKKRSWSEYVADRLPALEDRLRRHRDKTYRLMWHLWPWRGRSSSGVSLGVDSGSLVLSLPLPLLLPLPPCPIRARAVARPPRNNVISVC